MIPSLLSEAATTAGKTSPPQGALPDGTVAASFGEFMEEPEVAVAVDVFSKFEATSIPEKEADFGLPEVKVAQPDQQDPDQRKDGVVLAEPDATKDAQPDAETVLVQPSTQRTEPLPQSPDRRVDQAAPRDGAQPQRQLADRAVASDEQTRPQRPSVAQSVVEVRLPNAALPDVVAARISEMGLQQMAAKEAPPRSGELPMPDSVKRQVVDQGKRAATPTQPPVIPADEARLSRREKASPVTPDKAASLHAISMQPAKQPPAVALAQVAVQPHREVVEKSLKRVDGEMTMTTSTVERHASALNVQSGTPAVAAPETARHVATQIAMAVTNNPGKATEIALNPEELGRVRLSLSATDGAISLNILAERPETQDLLRRHMDQLAQEFRQLGYTSISFTFGEQNDQTHSETVPPDQTTELEIEEVLEPPNLMLDQSSSGLDLRI